MTDLDDPWQVRPDCFPANRSIAAQLRFLLNYAVLAPSGHNTQPWLFRLDADHVDVLADRTRALNVVDPQDRELTMSCAAAAETLALAARQFGFSPEVTALPEGPAADTIARVRLKKTQGHATSWAVLDAIANRRTTRVSYAPDPLPSDLRKACVAHGSDNSASVLFAADSPAREAISDLVAQGDRQQFSDPAFRRELANWIRSRASGGHDGMSGAAFGMPDMLSGLGGLMIRTFDIGGSTASGDARKIREGSPVLAAIVTPQDGPPDWVAAGRTLARMLITLSADGWTASYLNQPIEVDALRPQLRDVMGISGYPQLLLRIGRATLPSASARRPVQDVCVT